MLCTQGREIVIKTKYVNNVLKSKEKIAFVTKDMGDKVKISLNKGTKQQSFFFLRKERDSYTNQLNARRDLLCRFCVDNNIDIVI